MATDPCELLRQKYIQYAMRQREINRDRLAERYDLDPSKFTPEQLIDELSNKRGLDRNLLDRWISTPHTTDGIEAHESAMREVANGGTENAKSLDTPEGLKSGFATLRSTFNRVINGTFNSMPKSVNNAMKGFMSTLVGEREMHQIGTYKGAPVFIGQAEAKVLRAKTDALRLDPEVVRDVGNLPEDKFNIGVNILASMRGLEAAKTIEAKRAYIAKNEKARPILSGKKEWLNLAEAVNKSPKVREFIQQHYGQMDTIGDYLKSKDIASKHDNYWPNVIKMEEYQAPWEKFLMGNRGKISDWTDSKKYNHAIDFLIGDSDYMPASVNFSEVIGNYYRNVANAIRLDTAAEHLRMQAEFPSDDIGRLKMVGPGGVHEDAAVKNVNQEKDWEPPKTADNRDYQNLETVSGRFRGIYAHPDLYKWMYNAFGKHPELGGLRRIYMRTNALFKSLTIGAGFGEISYHGKAIAEKAIWLNLAKGTDGSLNPYSISAEGLSKLYNHDATVLQLFAHGMTSGQADMLRHPMLTSDYDPVTGQKKFLSKVGDIVNKYTSWQHNRLFDKWFLGMKAGTGARLCETEWFKTMAKSKGSDHAYETVAKILNDTFGGQNLEAMGRSKGFQTLMQATMLAPDWTESKMRRLFGAVASDNPDIRQAYKASLIAEVSTVAISHMILQQIANAVFGTKVSMEETALSWLKGEMGIIKIGKTRDGKKDITLRAHATAIEDIRPVAKTMGALWDSASQLTAGAKDILSGRVLTGGGEAMRSGVPTFKALSREAANKMSPLPRLAAEWAFGNKKPSKVPTSFDYPATPIPIAAGLAAAGGGYGKTPAESQKWILPAIAGGIAGTPVETRKAEKPAKKKNLSLMK